MAGISDKAIKSQYAQNKYRFNGGNGIQNNEFSDGSGLETYDSMHRMYDPQTGRFFRIDDFAEITYESSPYSFVLNNPVLFCDPFGDTVTLPTVTISVLKPGSLTYVLNYYSFGGVDAWVGGMMAKGHSALEIDKWATSNKLLNDDTRKWIINGTTEHSKKYRRGMASWWRTQGRIYKALLAAYVMRSAWAGISVAMEKDDRILDYEDLLEDVKLDGKELKNGELQGEVEANPGDSETNVARDATQIGKGQYSLRDGATVKFYQSTKGGGQSMQINTGGLIHKIRIK